MEVLKEIRGHWGWCAIEDEGQLLSFGPAGIGYPNSVEIITIKESLHLLKSFLHSPVVVEGESRNATV